MSGIPVTGPDTVVYAADENSPAMLWALDRLHGMYSGSIEFRRRTDAAARRGGSLTVYATRQPRAGGKGAGYRQRHAEAVKRWETTCDRCGTWLPEWKEIAVHSFEVHGEFEGAGRATVTLKAGFCLPCAGDLEMPLPARLRGKPWADREAAEAFIPDPVMRWAFARFMWLYDRSQELRTHFGAMSAVATAAAGKPGDGLMTYGTSATFEPETGTAEHRRWRFTCDECGVYQPEGKREGFRPMSLGFETGRPDGSGRVGVMLTAGICEPCREKLGFPNG